MAKTFGFSPWTRSWGQRASTPTMAPPLPSGSYDPGLDAQLGQASRGYGDLLQDAATQRTRGTVDYGLAREDVQRQSGWQGEDLATQYQRATASNQQSYDYGMQDADRSYGRTKEGLQTGYGRTTEDLGRERQYGQEDYQRNVGLLQRSYDQLANRQKQGMASAGVLAGGAALQAAAKRTANQAIDRQPLDTGFQRLNTGIDTAESRARQDYERQGRYNEEDFGTNRDRIAQGYQQTGKYLNEDYGTNTGRLQTSTDLNLGNLGLQYLRQYGDPSQGNYGDLGMQVARAGRENTQFGLDIGNTEAAQAAASGYMFDPYLRRR